ncbi:MAG: hypothetical protein ABR562_08550 [Thermoplasmatota archaeon]
MGQSTPTTTTAFDAFLQRYAPFRAELEPREQAVFDELVCRARRHSNAINRRPTLDFERPVILAMLLESVRLMDERDEGLKELENELREALRELRRAGLVAGRVSPPQAVLLGGVGQTRIDDHAALGAVPA